MTAELVVLAPVLMLFALLGIGLGRYEAARQEVADAAYAGAQAAAVAPDPVAATSAAEAASTAALAGQIHMCPDPVVRTDTAAFAANGAVSVTVTCVVGFSDLAVPGLPGRVTVSASAPAPVDPYRVVG